MTEQRPADVPWRAERSANATARLEAVRLVADERDMTFGEVVGGWREDAAFRDFFIGELTRTPWRAFFWEMPPISRDTMNRQFEYVTIDGPILETAQADPQAFLTELDALDAGRSVATFANLGGDAVLVVPRPLAGGSAYSHLGAFLHTAPREQKHELLAALADAIDARLRRRIGSIWISTAGQGVPWLHVRLDNRPKYYQHGPYQRIR